jgi:hypothetical protein
MNSKLFILLIAISVGVLQSCKSDSKTEGFSTNDINIGGDPGNLPVMKFTEEIHDFGQITQGEKVSYSFAFTNEGKSNLIISSAQGSCGCTVAQPPKEPVSPGKSGKIDVVFDSNGKSGKQEKNVTVITNGEPNTKILTIKAEIIVPTSNEPNKTSEAK